MRLIITYEKSKFTESVLKSIKDCLEAKTDNVDMGNHLIEKVEIIKEEIIKTTRDIIADNIGGEGISSIEIQPQIIDKINSEKWISIDEIKKIEKGDE